MVKSDKSKDSRSLVRQWEKILKDEGLGRVEKDAQRPRYSLDFRKEYHVQWLEYNRAPEFRQQLDTARADLFEIFLDWGVTDNVLNTLLFEYLGIPEREASGWLGVGRTVYRKTVVPVRELVRMQVQGFGKGELLSHYNKVIAHSMPLHNTSKRAQLQLWFHKYGQ